jgi:Repeat of unknown function (DUF5648)
METKSLKVVASTAFVFAMLSLHSPPVAAEFGKVIKIAGDRQIVVGPFGTPLPPFTVRVHDASGAPSSGVAVHITTTKKGSPCARNVDEFGFAGFNAQLDEGVCLNNGASLGFSDQAGLVTILPSDGNSPPSAFLIGARASVGNQQGVPEYARTQYFSIARAVNSPAGQPQIVVEYFNEVARNYFNTIYQSEIDVLDAGTFPDWTREVGSFIAWPTQAAAPPGAVPVCRFFGSKFTSHFYSADPAECDAVLASFPDWQLETREAFWIFLPDKVTGECGENLMPVWRVYRPSGPNHRYVTDRNVRDTMVFLAGWIAEGYGPDAVIMCTPR